MHWIPSELPLNGRRIAALKSPVMSGKECRDELRLLAKTRKIPSALFIRWIPAKLRPLDPNHPEHGYVSDDDPDQNEIWSADGCSFDDSIRIALFHFVSPDNGCFLDPNYDRLGVLSFLKCIRGFSSLELDFVAESHLGFRFCLHPDADKRGIFQQIAEFKRKHFQCDDDQEGENWQRHLFEKENTFSLGVV